MSEKLCIPWWNNLPRSMCLGAAGRTIGQRQLSLSIQFFICPCLFSKIRKLNPTCPPFNVKFLYLTFWNESFCSLLKKGTMPTPLLFSETDVYLRKEQHFHLCWKPAQAKCHLWKPSFLGKLLYSCFVIHCFLPGETFKAVSKIVWPICLAL